VFENPHPMDSATIARQRPRIAIVKLLSLSHVLLALNEPRILSWARRGRKALFEAFLVAVM
jgi:hypothetical protein